MAAGACRVRAGRRMSMPGMMLSPMMLSPMMLAAMMLWTRMIMVVSARLVAGVGKLDAIAWPNVVGVPVTIAAAIEVEHPVRLAGVELRIGMQKRAERDAILAGNARQRIAGLDGDRLMIGSLRAGCFQAALELITRLVIGRMISRLGLVDSLGPQQGNPHLV